AYSATGSGKGVEQISARAVDFGGSDVPLNADELGKRKLIQVPMVVGGLVPVVNLPGLATNRLRLNGHVLAEIMLGRVEGWNAPQIGELNPGLSLPSLPIMRIVRSDRSGSTAGFTAYLTKMSPTFKAEVGEGQAPNWPGRPLTADGNDGLVQRLSSTVG